MDDVHAKGAQGELRMQVSMTINGLARTLTVEPRMTLLDALMNWPSLVPRNHAIGANVGHAKSIDAAAATSSCCNEVSAL